VGPKHSGDPSKMQYSKDNCQAKAIYGGEGNEKKPPRGGESSLSPGKQVGKDHFRCLLNRLAKLKKLIKGKKKRGGKTR